MSTKFPSVSLQLPGLSSSEAARKRIQYGPNVVAHPVPPHLGRRIANQLTDPLIVLLAAAALVTTLLGEFTNTTIIALVIIVNSTIGIVQELRADSAIAALRRLAAPTAVVRRDGVRQVVPASDVVPGDYVFIAAGDIIPADMILLQTEQLQVNEAALTGESFPVSRAVGEQASAGTVVAAGRGEGEVLHTGAASSLGRIAELVVATSPGRTPLQQRLAHLGRVLGVVVVVLSALIALLGVLNGRPLLDMLITAVSLVVAAIPESLPAVVTLALALGARRMAHQAAITRSLRAVETLGSTTIFVTDKTGTLTEGRMTVRHILDRTGHELDAANCRDLALAAVLCNDATFSSPEPMYHGEPAQFGDPLEIALLQFAGDSGVDPETARQFWPRLAEIPFDPNRRHMITVHGNKRGRARLICKGAPEVMLTGQKVDEPPDTIKVLHHSAQQLAAQGLRVIVIAQRELLHIPRTVEEIDQQGNRLAVLGLIAVGDPIRTQAPHLIQDLHQAGIKTMLITGDHPATAKAVAQELGIWSNGGQTRHGDDPDFPGTDPAQVQIYARTRPEQKLAIVTALQNNGAIVAMTGDGVNDAPALRSADIGVAMGKSGTEVARQAADLVLANDDLEAVTSAVYEGRRIYTNIRRFLQYGLSGGLAEIVIMLCGPFLGLTVPLLPTQILWINLLTHGLPGVALGAEPADANVATQPPRSPTESILSNRLWHAITTIGTVIAVMSLTVGAWASQTNHPWQSMLFVTLGFGQLGVALAVRGTRKAAKNHRFLEAAVALSAVLQFAAVFAPGLRSLLQTTPLTFAELTICAAAAVIPGIITLAYRRWS